MERDSFVFYRSFFEAVSTLQEDEQVKCYDAISRYALNGELVELQGIPKAIFTLIKPQLDANNKRFLDGKKGAEYGKLGGRPKKKKGDGDNNKNPTGVSEDTQKETPNVNVNVNVNANENENVNIKEIGDKPRSVFKPPTLEEVKEYCFERNNGIDAQQFIDFYSSKGWMIGKNKMKDWKAAVRTWEQRNNRPAPTTSQGFFKVDDDFFRRKMGL